MNAQPSSPENTRWIAASIGALAAVVIVTALVGYVWIPRGQQDTRISGLWNAICSAVGLAEPERPVQQPISPVARPSDVVVTANMMEPADNLSIGRGATLALQCTMCHGARGMSQADSPNLAGQYEAAMYKQLRDFKSGHRKSAVMAPLVQNLGDQEMRDLAAYYAYLPRETPPTSGGELAEPPVIARNGAPMRNIAACDSCHGEIDHKPGTPRLDGEPEVYIRAQLKAFASGARGNDIYGQMRNIARQMTADEIDTVARYYSRR